MKTKLQSSHAVHLGAARFLNLGKTIAGFLVAILLFAIAVPSSQAGVALKLFYDGAGNLGISNNLVTNFTSDATFPNTPDAFYSETLTNGLTISQTAINNYGTWTRGFIEAPQTGQYTFWIASDDEGQLWLSTDETPAHLVHIAENLGAVGYEAYSSANQTTNAISLVAGHKYYFEMLHKQGGGGTHCEVAWLLPDNSYEAVLSPNHLWPYPVDRTNPSYPAGSVAPSILATYDDANAGTSTTVTTLPATTTVVNGRGVDLTITAEASQPATVYWYSNSVLVANANLLNYHVPRINTAQNGDVYSVVVSNSLGVSSTASTTISVTPDTTPPTLLDALILGNPANDISVVFSEGVDPATGGNIANYSINNGATIISAQISSDSAAVLLRTSGLVPGTAYTVTVNNVQDLAGNPIAANSTVAVDQNLNTWFRMDDATGTTVTDSSGNGKNGTLTNDTAPDYTGKVLRATKFGGLAGYIAMQNGYNDFTSGMTVAVWAYPTTTLNGWARFIDLGNGPGADNIIFARNGTSANLTFEVRLGTPSAGQITANGALSLNQWQHFVATMDATGHVILYKNGIALTNGTLTGVPNIVLRTNCYVGRSDFAQDGYYQGKMDDLRIYNRVLSPDAILALASGGGADDSSIPAVSVVATTPTTAEKATPPGVFTVTRTGSTASALTVQYALSGTATNGVNYNTLSGSVTIPIGAASATVSVTPIDLTFSQLTETAILTLSANANYTIADADNDTVTIQNNDVSPAASTATADNAIGAVPTTIDVWFKAGVTAPTATTLANYTLNNAPGLSITNATLGNHNLRVVLGISGGVVPTGATLSVSGVKDAGGNTVPATIPISIRLPAVNVIANTYHGGAGNRAAAFTFMNNGVVNNTANGGTGFDTFVSTAPPTLTQFGGMFYPAVVDFRAIKVDLGQQFGDGGNWKAQPSVYILKNPVDTASTRPESDTNDWVQVPAVLISGSQFSVTGDANPSPNTPITFDLSGLTASQRTGYGWAVGGVFGNGTHGFISLTEMRAYGVPATPAIAFVQQPQNVTVTAGQRAIFSGLVTNFWDANSPIPVISYQWLRNGTPIASATNGTFTTAQTTVGTDNGAQFTLVESNGFGVLTSSTATLTVLARTTAPVVVASGMDLFGNIDVWFDEPVDPTTAQTLGNYSVNDPALTLTSTIQEAFQCGVKLTFTGSPSVANPTLTVSGVMDTFGNTMGSSQTVSLLAQDWPAQNLVANQYQQGRAAMLGTLTNGVVQTTVTAATFGDPFGLSDFAGLIYSQPQVFGIVKVDLGHQFGDGGDWSAVPTVYILKSPVDSNQSHPESNTNWVAVPATLVSGNIFSWVIDGPNNTPPVNTPITFDLSHLSNSQRAGYGWAIGGVPGNALTGATVGTGTTPAAEFLSLSQLRAFGSSASAFVSSGPPQILLDVQPRTPTLLDGETVTFSTVVTGTQPITYQWKFNGVNLSDNGRISGSHSSVLTVGELLASDAGNYQLFMTNSAGTNLSAVANLAVTRIALNNGAGFSLNGGAVIASNVLTLTDGVNSEARSSFLTSPEYIGGFRASFTYQDVGGSIATTTADGVVFVLQDSAAGASALGAAGNGLGYTGANPPMTNSVGLEFNIYSGTTNGIAFNINAVASTLFGRTGALRLDSGDPIGVTLNYDGTTLFLTMTDAVAAVSFNTNFVANIPAILGTNSAYVGFTGATGGVNATQKITNFSFASLPSLSTQMTGANTLVISWPSSAGGLVLQKSTTMTPGSWVNVNNPVSYVSGVSQVTISPVTGTAFYRLTLP